MEIFGSNHVNKHNHHNKYVFRTGGTVPKPTFLNRRDFTANLLDAYLLVLWDLSDKDF